MYLVISHQSALGYWRRFRGDAGRFLPIAGPEPIGRKVIIDERLATELSALGFNPDREYPLDLLYPAPGLRSQACAIRSHLGRSSLPAGSLLRLSEHVAIASPELTFAQMASRYSMGQLLMCACEMCGTYVPVSSAPDPEERSPLTSTAKLGTFLVALGLGSRAKAIRAARFAFDNAASPMEARLALLLSLPQTMGGFGLPRPALNVPITLSPAAYRVCRRNPCRMDLYWPEAAYDVEYDGSLHNEERRDSDNAREVALKMEGIEVLTLRKWQVYDARDMASIAKMIAGKLGRRFRISTRDFERRHLQLRKEIRL